MNNHLLFITRSALFDFSRHKLRTFLASLGIFIGVCAVILLVALGTGLKTFITSQFEGLGTNLVFVLPGRVTTQGGGFRPGGGTLGGVRFDEKDAIQLRKIKNIMYVVPYIIKTVRVYAGAVSEIADIRGTTADHFIVSHSEILKGGVFGENDVDKRRKIAILGETIAQKLFGTAEWAVGRTVRVEKQRFLVIGVLAKKGDISHDFDSALFIPYKTAFLLTSNRNFFDLHIQVDHDADIAAVKKKIHTTLLKRYDENDFSVLEQVEILSTFNTIIQAVSTIVTVIGAISLIVGGIGIMNIMYMSVVERTREIGIRRAVGATKRDILLLFLTESVLLALFGGIAGLIAASGIILVARRFFPVSIESISVLVAIVVSSAIGIFFGVAPAKKASDLSPIDAIRYE